MKIEPIFLNADWDADAQTLFWETLKKKRSQKLLYVNKKASFLAKFAREQGLTDAIALLDHFVQDYLKNEVAILAKSKYPLVDKLEMADICSKIGQYYARLEQLDKTEAYFLLGAKIHESYPNDPELHARRSYEGYLELADIFLKKGLLKEAAIYMDLQENRISENENLYGLAQARARLAYRTADWEQANRLWEQFYKDIETHQTYLDLETEPYIDVMGDAEANPVAATEAIVVYHHSVCPEIFAKDRSSLQKLDGLLMGEVKTNDGEDYSIWTYKSEFITKQLLPELGAYLGEVWVNSLGGTWVLNPLLMQSRVSINGKLWNPFEYAYKALYWRYRLSVECFDALK